MYIYNPEIEWMTCQNFITGLIIYNMSNCYIAVVWYNTIAIYVKKKMQNPRCQVVKETFLSLTLFTKLNKYHLYSGSQNVSIKVKVFSYYTINSTGPC